jgi:hypothetical protein
MSPERQKRAERRGRKQAQYVEMPKDKVITEGLDALGENAAAALFGEAGKRRALFLLGESDSGKTRAMEYHIPMRPEFRPYVTKSGQDSGLSSLSRLRAQLHSRDSRARLSKPAAIRSPRTR